MQNTSKNASVFIYITGHPCCPVTISVLNMNRLIIDFQGFKNEQNEFIIKELSVLHVASGSSQTWIFLPPFSYDAFTLKHKRTILWVESYHGLSWSEGDIVYERCNRLLRTIIEPNSVVFVKGEEKRKFIATKFKCNVINLEELGCPSLRHLYQYNTQHTGCLHVNHVMKISSFYCAKRNIELLFLWYKDCSDISQERN